MQNQSAVVQLSIEKDVSLQTLNNQVSKKLKRKNKKPFYLSFLCCCQPTDNYENEQNQPKSIVVREIKISRPKLKDEPTKLQLMNQQKILKTVGCNKSGNFCWVKFTQKNFLLDDFYLGRPYIIDLPNTQSFEKKTKQNNKEFDFYIPGDKIFSNYYRGIRLSENDHSQSLPYKVMIHISTRIAQIKPNVLVDAIAGTGQASIYFTLEDCAETIISIEDKKISQAQHNSKIYHVRKNLELIKGNFLNLNLSKADLVYIQTSFSIKLDKVNEIATTEIDQDIPLLLNKALSITDNVVLVVPYQIPIQELCEQIGFQLRVYNKKTCKLEMQIIKIDGYLRYYVVYIGEVSKITQQEEDCYIVQNLLQDNNNDSLIEPSFNLVQLARLKMSPLQLVDLIEKCYFSCQEEIILIDIIRNLIKDEILTTEQILDIYHLEDIETILFTQTPKMIFTSEASLTFNQSFKLSGASHYQSTPFGPPIRQHSRKSIFGRNSDFNASQGETRESGNPGRPSNKRI